MLPAAEFLPLLRRLAATLAVAWLAALAAQAMHVPLPWMIGPLLISALLGVSGVPVASSLLLRNLGHWMIGVALGLYFSPPVIGMLLTLAPAVAASVAWALLLGYGFYRFLLAVNAGPASVDRTSAFFASTIGGASEMALLAERNDGQVDRVAAAHSLRVLLVVVVVPVAFLLSGVHGADPTLPAVLEVRPLGLLALLAASGAGMLLLGWLGLPNPWVLGALLVTAALTTAGITPSALPRWASNAGQLFIGVALGTRFTPAFVRVAPRWLASVAVGTLVMILASAGFAWCLALVVEQHPATLLLATAPGGTAEMCITAKVLQLGVPVVTGFHVVRYIAVLILTAPLYRWEMRRTGGASA